MSFIVALALLGMMSSMLVSESLDGDAANINAAGALRMQSVRLSRSLVTEQNHLSITAAPDVAQELSDFKQRLSRLEVNLGQQLQNDEIRIAHAALTKQWLKIDQAINTDPTPFSTDFTQVDQFVETIDQLVLVLQQQSEVKIRALRIIQITSMFLIVLTAFIAVSKINKSIVRPMNNLVRAASEAGKGNFSVKTDNRDNNEIGLLARTFSDMSAQLRAMHDQFEERVQIKTSSLEQRNKSLELLYLTTHNLVRSKQDGGYQDLIQHMEETLGHGKIMLCIDDAIANANTAKHLQPISSSTSALHCQSGVENCTDCLSKKKHGHQFGIAKNDDTFGFLRYFTETKLVLEPWQNQLLQTIADNIAVSISLDRKRSQEALIALQEERTVIARELHDSLAQSLSYLKMQTSVLAKQLSKDLPRSAIDETIGGIRDGLSDAYRQLRELLTTFRLQVEGASLESALKATAVEFSHKCQHPVELNIQIASMALSANQQIHILQIIREALSNIQRHAQASEAHIRLQQSGNTINLSVSDNGKGFDSIKSTKFQYGISIMNERAESLGSKLTINSSLEKGTDVQLDFVSTAIQSDLNHTSTLADPTLSS